MTKIASNAVLESKDLIKIACYGLSTVLSTPRYGFTPEQVTKVATAYANVEKRRQDRHNKLTQLIASHAV